ncbi:hypothetical protein LTR93_011328 [Exophiala xenobiotica]|nr:hypothetical protein LTR93_011328 [Exophiala xenobiotica]
MSPKVEVPGVALITGAASGIGQSIALAFAQAGCSRLALLDRNEDGLVSTKVLAHEVIVANGRHAQIATYDCDVSSPEAMASIYASVKATFDRIDYSIHCAAISGIGRPTADTPIEDFDKLNSVDYRGLWLCCREALRNMRTQALDSEVYHDADIPSHRAQRGAIVNISSGLALYAQANSAPYCGAKAAVLGLTRADAIDYATERIRVNSILPGVIETPMTSSDPKRKAWMEANPVQKTPFKRFGKPDEVADVAVFLAGNRASYVSGASWAVDGGFIAGYN